MNMQQQMDRMRMIIPPMQDNATANQQVLYALATGTGGFPIINSNDFLAGLNKISAELNEYYVVGYVPPSQDHDGSFHSIKVKVDRKGVEVRSRSGYYDTKGSDVLKDKPEGKTLEAQAASPQEGDFSVSISTPYFYTEPNVARVNVALVAPAGTFDFQKDKGKFHSKVNILGIAYREDGGVAARFSDTMPLDLEKKEMKEFTKGDFHYQNNFDIAPGKYTLKVVLSAGGQKFGKLETPLSIEPYTGKKFQLSGIALSNTVVPVSQVAGDLDQELMEERTPLVVANAQIVPSADNRFKRGDRIAFYCEVYEPALMSESFDARVGVLYNLVDTKTGQQVFSSGTILVNNYIQKGSPVIPVGVSLPMDKLQAGGQYRLEVQARDSMTNVSSQHIAQFDVQ